MKTRCLPCQVVDSVHLGRHDHVGEQQVYVIFHSENAEGHR